MIRKWYYKLTGRARIYGTMARRYIASSSRYIRVLRRCTKCGRMEIIAIDPRKDQRAEVRLYRCWRCILTPWKPKH